MSGTSTTREKQQRPGDETEDDDAGCIGVIAKQQHTKADNDDSNSRATETAAAAAAAATAQKAQLRRGAAATPRNSNNNNNRNQQSLFDSLHDEMELVAYGRSHRGQNRRKISKKESSIRTRKRRKLEEEDRQLYESAGSDDDEQEEGESSEQQTTTATATATTTRLPSNKKLRGSRAAFEDRVIQGSMIFGGDSQGKEQEDEEALDADDDDDDDDDNQELVGGDDDGRKEGEDDDNADDPADKEDEVGDDDDNDEEEDLAEEEEAPRPARKDPPPMSTKKRGKYNTQRKDSSSNSRRRPKRRQRLKNFRSAKMAERHGAALGFHAQGKHNLAIRKLRQVAQKAPSAPQIYSSLGMIYEDMLLEDQRRHRGADATTATAAASQNNEQPAEAESVDRNNALPGSVVTFSEGTKLPASETDSNVDLIHQLNLAKKAFGSYHVAAILCKRDYTLWLRSADSAAEIASLHLSLMQLPRQNDQFVTYHRSERQRWLEEAKNDYQWADNLNPPGIDAPAKLAQTMLELGMLSECLTLLTDLKSHSDFDASYRAWLLYADLMLRIGHECNQWNAGIFTNSNYMYRRWLRKHASSFDWQERRLQALVKALEAATGSRCCKRLVQWLQGRVMSAAERVVPTASVQDRGEDEKKDTEYLDDENGEAEEKPDNEKHLMISNNRSVLAAFDKTTEELNLENGSIAATDRESARSELIKKHESSLQQLDHVQGTTEKVAAMAGDSLSSVSEERNARELPLSGSRRSVFAIASELLRHLLVMRLYTGARLVGETVSLYLKERFAMQEEKKKAAINYEQAQQRPTSIFAMQHEAYDGSDDAQSNSSENDVLLSDEEELEEKVELEAMRHGILPPEIRLLFGLGLAGEGGKIFLASQCLKAVLDLPQEHSAWLTEVGCDTGVNQDSSFQIMRQTMTEPLGRTAAFAFITDTILQSDKENDMAPKITDLYHRHASDLSNNGMLDIVLERKRKDSIPKHRQEQVVKVLVALMRYEVKKAESELAGQRIQAAIRGTFLSDTLTSLSKLLPVVWTVENGSVSSTCAEAIDAVARTLHMFASNIRLLSESLDHEQVRCMLSKAIRLVAIICDSPSLSITETSATSLTNLVTIPLSSSWISPDLQPLALRAFNLCIATNVSLFSGFESEEFSVRLLKGSAHNFFGISVDGGIAAGIISEDVEEELAVQWDLVQKLLPDLMFSFRSRLEARRGNQDYQRSKDLYKQFLLKQPIAFNGEQEALSAILSFSRVCLSIVPERKEGSEKLICISLCILLPISQFVLNERLWNSSIGQRSVKGSSNLPNWLDSRTERKEGALPAAPAKQKGYIRPSQQRAQRAADKSGERSLHDWFSWEDDEDTLSNLVGLPLSVLQKEWLEHHANFAHVPSNGVAAFEAMRAAHTSMRRMRSSYSVQAVEKAALQVAANLLKVVAFPECRSPFLCLQQAASFASQSSKLGTNDKLFQERLPKLMECTPHDALLILGRADCLQAVHFCQEAAFLCAFAASACRLRRRTQNWSRGWKIVAILTYDLSVRIRYVAGSLVERNKTEDCSKTWEAHVIDELSDARDDGMAWIQRLQDHSVPEKGPGSAAMLQDSGR